MNQKYDLPPVSAALTDGQRYPPKGESGQPCRAAWGSGRAAAASAEYPLPGGTAALGVCAPTLGGSFSSRA